MRIRIGNNASIFGIRPEVVLALHIAAQEAHRKEIDVLWLSSVTDGTHSPKSLHHTGAALDLVPDPRPITLTGLRDAIGEALGPDYDVVEEPTHLHIEWQPGPARR